MSSETSLKITLIRGSEQQKWICWKEVWEHRELIVFLVIRDIKVKYKQASLGILWVLAQPLFMMLTYSFLFGRVAGLDSEELPYSVFSFAGLVPWAYFSGAMGRGSLSLVGGAALFSKVYFPRVIIPVSSLLAGLMDYGLSLATLFLVMAFHGLSPSFHCLWGIPILTFWIFLLAFGMSCWFGSLNVKYRDIGHVLPFLTQVLMFATPVVYSMRVLPHQYLPFVYLNPLAGIIEAYRGVLFNRPVDPLLLGSSILITIVVFLTGLRYFSKTERSFADII